MASWYESRRNYAEADSPYKHALAIEEDPLCENHPYPVLVCRNMAKLHKGIDKEDDAERLKEWLPNRAHEIWDIARKFVILQEKLRSQMISSEKPPNFHIAEFDFSK